MFVLVFLLFFGVNVNYLVGVNDQLTISVLTREREIECGTSWKQNLKRIQQVVGQVGHVKLERRVVV